MPSDPIARSVNWSILGVTWVLSMVTVVQVVPPSNECETVGTVLVSDELNWVTEM